MQRRCLIKKIACLCLSVIMLTACGSKGLFGKNGDSDMKELEDKDKNETVDTEEEQDTPTSYNEEMSYTPFADLFKKLKL